MKTGLTPRALIAASCLQHNRLVGAYRNHPLLRIERARRTYRFGIAPRRSRQLRFNNFEDPESIAPDTPFSSVIVSDVPVVVQHTRLDSCQAENALLSTIAFAGDP
jgi:hypothetical protein